MPEILQAFLTRADPGWRLGAGTAFPRAPRRSRLHLRCQVNPHHLRQPFACLIMQA